MMSCIKIPGERLLTLGMALVCAAWTAQAQAAPFIYYPTHTPTAVGTAMAGTPTTFDASATLGSSYIWKFKGCGAGACPTGKIVTWTYPAPGRTYVMLTVDGKTFPNVAVQVQQGTFTVTVTPSEGGKVTAGPGVGAGLACGSGDTRCQESYLDDVGVLLHAAPEPGWVVSHWMLDGTTKTANEALLFKGKGPHAAQAIFVPTALTIVSTPPPLIRSQYYWYEVTVSGQHIEHLSFTLVQAPEHMKIERDTGVIFWEPAQEQMGEQLVRVRVENDRSDYAEQTFTLTVTPYTFDLRPPDIAITTDKERILLGESISIDFSASDNFELASSSLHINNKLVLTSSGTTVYTPDAPGEYMMTAVAKDRTGNQSKMCTLFWVYLRSATIKFYEGFDADRGMIEHDPHILFFVPNTPEAVTQTAIPADIDQQLRFYNTVEFHLAYTTQSEHGVKIFLNDGARGAILSNTPYDGVNTVPSVETLTAWTDGRLIAPEDTVVLLTAEGRFFKIGNMTRTPSAWTVQFDYTELTQ